MAELRPAGSSIGGQVKGNPVRTLLLCLFVGLLVGVLSLAGLVAFGGPVAPPALASVNAPFASIDLSDLPVTRHVPARDGVALGYAHYPAAQPRASLLLIHGSSANLRSLHVLAQHLQGAGYSVYSLDMRGHGETGERGQIDYLGQLEDDIDDFLAGVNPPGPHLLGGFSAGGGFALRYATSARRAHFDGYLLLAPFVHHQAPNARPAAGGWVDVGVPRLVGLLGMNALGIERFNRLPVMSFALSDTAAAQLTPFYAYHLALNFRGPDDYLAALPRLTQPTSVVAGEADEIFLSQALPAIFASSPRPVPVSLVPGLGHSDLTLRAEGLAAISAALDTQLATLATPTEKRQ